MRFPGFWFFRICPWKDLYCQDINYKDLMRSKQTHWRWLVFQHAYEQELLSCVHSKTERRSSLIHFEQQIDLRELYNWKMNQEEAFIPPLFKYRAYQCNQMRNSFGPLGSFLSWYEDTDLWLFLKMPLEKIRLSRDHQKEPDYATGNHIEVSLFPSLFSNNERTIKLRLRHSDQETLHFGARQRTTW